ncbi:MAG: AAA family ATPase [Cyanobacteriota bacterium]|nr:AAA family ATPase [Cyanobacteriota bacterium]
MAQIETLTLTHFRGASALSLQLEPRLNVLIGVNGAGKSTILDAVALMLSWAISRIRQAGTSGRHISEDDIANGQSAAMIELSYLAKDKRLSWRLAKSRPGHGPPPRPSALGELSDYAKTIQGAIAAMETPAVNIPLFVHYSVNRAVLDIPLRIRERHQFDLLSIYDESLTGGADFRRFFEWFREREDLENEHRKYQDALIKPDDYCFPDPHLEAVRTALGQILPAFNHLAVRRHPLRMEVTKNGQVLKLNQLSDGEKCLIALISDLARRLAIANPMGNPLEGEGIVLIDEIDLHLHPQWQRVIIPRLLAVFPNCQFIISTHSPHVLTHVQPENIFILTQNLDNIVVTKPRESYGKTVERILEDLMGLETTRPQSVNQDLHHIYQLINNRQLPEAEQAIVKMRTKIGNDPELIKAEVLIRRQEIIGR